MEPRIPVSEHILLYAFRYALGRQTYSVGDLRDVILEANAQSLLSDTMKIMIASEIDDAIRAERLVTFDEHIWKTVRDTLNPMYK